MPKFGNEDRERDFWSRNDSTKHVDIRLPAAREFELFGRLHAAGRELFVINGTSDKVHDRSHYPRIARELPGGRFLYLPASLAGFEKRVR